MRYCLRIKETVKKEENFYFIQLKSRMKVKNINKVPETAKNFLMSYTA